MNKAKKRNIIIRRFLSEALRLKIASGGESSIPVTVTKNLLPELYLKM